MNGRMQMFVDRLRNNDYEQVVDYLSTRENTFCSVGVMCEVYRENHPFSKWVSGEDSYHVGATRYFLTHQRLEHEDEEQNIFPQQGVIDWFDMNRGSVDAIGFLNDYYEYSFEDVADLIEAQPEFFM